MTTALFLNVNPGKKTVLFYQPTCIMKTYISIFVIAMSLIVVGCNSKREKTAEEIKATEDSLQMVREDSLRAVVADRKAKLKEARDAKANQRRTVWEEKAKTSPTYKDKSGNVVYYKSEVDPSYTGGSEAMNQYLKDNLKYPETALNNRDEGTVFVEFVVDKKGKVRDVVAVESTWNQADSTLVNEAVRVVSGMPTWVAGTKGGKPVDVAYSIPITFELDN